MNDRSHLDDHSLMPTGWYFPGIMHPDEIPKPGPVEEQIRAEMMTGGKEVHASLELIEEAVEESRTAEKRESVLRRLGRLAKTR